MSLEVGRIIREFESASTLNFKKVKYRGERPYKGHQVPAATPSAPGRSSAARAAHRRQASSHICFGPVTPASSALAPWVNGWRLQRSGGATFDIQGNTQGVARQRHRQYWPETNVGAGLPAMRRAGGARSPRRRKTQGEQTQKQNGETFRPPRFYIATPASAHSALRVTRANDFLPAWHTWVAPSANTKSRSTTAPSTLTAPPLSRSRA